MQSVRPRTLLAVAAIVLAAGGVATGGAVATRGSSAAPGLELEVRGAVIEAADLYPTAPDNPDPAQVATGVVRLGDTAAGANGPVRLAASCECAPGTPEAQQFEDLVIEVVAEDGKVYSGPLSELDADIVDDDKTTVKVWLADTGKPQAQGVETRFSLVATPAESD